MRIHGAGKFAETSLEAAGRWAMEGGGHTKPIWADSLEARPAALKATSLDLTSDPTGMCAAGGAAGDAFRPGVWWRSAGFRAKTPGL